MLTLYSAPRTRALRIAWLLEEMGVPYQLETVEFQTTSSAFFIQKTPTGKIPTLVDGSTVLCESGAIVQYLLEQYPSNALEPKIGNAERGAFLQWLHFSESTAFGPLGIVVWLTLYRQDAANHPEVVNDAIQRAGTGLAYLQQHLEGEKTEHLLASGFSAADIMMGFTLLAAQQLQQLEDKPALANYLQRLTQRPAFITAAQKVGGFSVP